MISQKKIDRNINLLHSVSEWIRKNEREATISGDITVKIKFVEKLLFYEDIRKDTIVLLESFFKEEGTVVNLTYRQLHKRITES